MSRRETDRLLILIREGDNAAFERLYEQTKRGVFAFLRTYLPNPADTEDAMQTVYLKIKTGIAGYQAGTNGSAWILQIAKNHALTTIRKTSREIPTEEIEVVSSPSHIVGVVNDTMEKVLSEEERRIIVLHVLWGYKHREIAVQLGCPTGTVTSKYKRAIEKMRQALKEEEE